VIRQQVEGASKQHRDDCDTGGRATSSPQSR
jgi:hypothetical protein